MMGHVMKRMMRMMQVWSVQHLDEALMPSGRVMLELEFQRLVRLERPREAVWEEVLVNLVCLLRRRDGRVRVMVRLMLDHLHDHISTTLKNLNWTIPKRLFEALSRRLHE